MVRSLLSAAIVVAAPALTLSCQMVWGIEEKRLAEADGDAGPESTSALPPPRPAGSNASGNGDPLYFAARRLFLGTISPDTLQGDAQYWSKLGYDIDGKCTTAQQSANDASGVCHKVDFVVSADSMTDGEGCRDNAGGHALAGAFTSLDNPERQMQVLLDEGSSYTLVLRIEDLGAGADDAEAPGKLYVGSPRVAADPPRKWDGTDRIAIDNRSVINGTLKSPKVDFPKGYMKGHVWVSDDFRTPVDQLPLPLFGAIYFAPVRIATLTVRFDATHKKILESTISTAMPGDAFREAVWPGLLLQAQCSEMGANVAFAKLRDNTDLADKPPRFVDPVAFCNLMSVGMQPVWAPVAAPPAVVQARPAPSLCE